MWTVSVQQNANQGSDAAWGRVREADDEGEAGGGRSKMDYEGRRSWGQKDPREMSRFPLLVPSTSTSLAVHPRRTERMWTRWVRELAVTWSPHFEKRKKKKSRPTQGALGFNRKFLHSLSADSGPSSGNRVRKNVILGSLLFLGGGSV